MGTHILPCHEKVIGQPAIITGTNLVDLQSPMVYTKIQSQSFLGSGGADFKGFTIYGYGGHLVQWCSTICTNCHYPFNRRPHIKSDENWLSGFLKITQFLHVYSPGARSDKV